MTCGQREAAPPQEGLPHVWRVLGFCPSGTGCSRSACLPTAVAESVRRGQSRGPLVP